MKRVYRKKWRVKNITSNISPEKSIMEIEQILVTFGAKKILKEYKGSQTVAISFIIELDDGKNIPFKLPMKIEKARAIIEKAVHEKKLPRKFLSEPYRSEKAQIVGWRVIKDWIHSQLSFFEIQYADPVEIFLPYVYNPETGQTFYEQIKEKQFDKLVIEHKEK